MATRGVGEFWEKFHHYHRLQAELEKLYLWFEEFEQRVSRDNQELDRILLGVQAVSGSRASIVAKTTARRPVRGRTAAVAANVSPATRGQAGRRPPTIKSR
ncbi:MAG: hypothetical protein ACYCZN_01205 [Candidatus Dormibacteria bacterium]